MINCNYKQFVRSALTVATIALMAVPAVGQLPLDTRRTAIEINDANSLLRAGKVDDAIDAYRRVVPGEQLHHELSYNLAVAEYRKGNIDAAELLFVEGAEASSATLAADSRYNLGNCQYAKALQAAEKDKSAAIDLLRKAISNYRSGLRAKPNNPDARANIELAGELIRRLEQQQTQEEQQHKSQSPESQEDQEDKSQEKNEQQRAAAQDEQSDEQQKSEQQKGEQESSELESQPDQQKSPEQQSQANGSEGKNEHSETGQQQSSDPQKSEEGMPDEQEAKDQAVPTGDLKAASQQDKNQEPGGTDETADPGAKDGLMTREEALKMLQSVRDRDMLRRMQQQRQERSRRVPVEKDW